MIPNSNPQNSKSKNNRMISWVFIIFFSTFIIVDVVYIVIAEKTWRGLVTENGYQKGLKYNQVIDAAKEQKKLGWNMQIKYHSRKTKTGNLQVNLLDKNHHVISDAILSINIKRPVQEGKDFVINLKFDSKTSNYQSYVDFPMIGQWDLEIIAKKNDDVYQDLKRIVVR